jgi:putative Holliday junction resolvase
VVRWLAIDPGEARVGLAICDPDERVAVPLEVVPASAAFPAIRAIVTREEVAGIVIGLPLLPSGDEGEAAAMARRLGARLGSGIAVPIVYEDERLTSDAAEQRARAAGRSGPSDDLAATVLLEQFLAGRRAGGETTEDARADAGA